MDLHGWWDCEVWEEMSLNRWMSSHELDWQDQTAYDWMYQSRETWAGKQVSILQPAYPEASLESVGFSQDEDYVYIPCQSINAPDWLNMEDWNFALTKEKFLFLLMLKLQSANLPAHKVTGVGIVEGDYAFVLESRAEVING